VPAIVGVSQEDQPFFAEGMSKTFTQTFYHSDLLDGTTLTVATPLFDVRQKRIGVLALHFNMKRVDSIIHEDPQFISTSVQTYLIDSRNRVITDDPIILAQAATLYSPATELALKGGQGTASYANHKNVQVIGTYMWIEDQNVVLITEIDRKIALQPARQLAVNISVVGLLFSIFLVIAVVIMAQRITAPLRALSETVSHISQGQLGAAAPILSDDEVGALARAFNAMTEKLRNTLADMQEELRERRWIEQEREKLIRELELKNTEAETLRRSLASIVGTLEFNEIIDRVLEEIRYVIPYDTASVWRVEGDEQHIISGVDLPPEIKVPGTVFRVDEGNSAYPLIMGTLPYILNNNVQVELIDFQQPPHNYVQSWLAIPLKTRGRIIGIIALDGRRRDQFTDHHAGLAVTFGNQLAIALDNSRLFAELQSELEERKRLISELEMKNAEAQTLRESVAIVAATLEKSEAVDRILEQLERVVPFDSASVQLINGNMLEMVSTRGFPLSPDPSKNRFELNTNEPAYPVLEGSVPYVLYEDIQASIPAFWEAPHNQIRAWMAVPLKVKGRILGIIALDGYRPGQFSKRHAQLAVTYANQVAIALENARLFSDLQSELVARKKLISELENKNAELERFTYTVSHDLKSPLFTIRGFLGYLEQDALSGNHARLKSDIQRIIDATDKMQQLLNELLELSRVGRLKNESTSFPFEELAREAVDLVQGSIMARGITVSVEADLPLVYGDRPRLTEVLQNLLDNAAKFMGDQEEPLIEIGCAQEDPEAEMTIFYVRDNGAGIPHEHYDRVFGLFNKLDPKTDGTGIGLALVKRILEVHGGRIWVESEVEKGSTFFFTLPAKPQPDSVI
jgi:signal transduction histidine kinase